MFSGPSPSADTDITSNNHPLPLEEDRLLRRALQHTFPAPRPSQSWAPRRASASVSTLPSEDLDLDEPSLSTNRSKSPRTRTCGGTACSLGIPAFIFTSLISRPKPPNRNRVLERYAGRRHWLEQRYRRDKDDSSKVGAQKEEDRHVRPSVFLPGDTFSPLRCKRPVGLYLYMLYSFIRLKTTLPYSCASFLHDISMASVLTRPEPESNLVLQSSKAIS